MDIQLKKGVLGLCVLGTLADKDDYGYNIYRMINEALGISESTIYPILRKMVKQGLLQTALRDSPDGPPRKYFTITQKGLEELNTLKASWTTFKGRVERFIEE